MVTLCSHHPSAADLEGLRLQGETVCLLIRGKTIPWLSELQSELAHPGATSIQCQTQCGQKGNVQLEAQGAGLLFIAERGDV